MSRSLTKENGLLKLAHASGIFYLLDSDDMIMDECWDRSLPIDPSYVIDSTIVIKEEDGEEYEEELDVISPSGAFALYRLAVLKNAVGLAKILKKACPSLPRNYVRNKARTL